MAHNGKHALITGSSRGIGRGIALKLAERGVRVAINYRKNEAAAKDTLAKVRQAGSDGFTVQADVCRAEDIARMVGRAKQEFGTLDIFVSNARPDVPEFYQGPMSITMPPAANRSCAACLTSIGKVLSSATISPGCGAATRLATVASSAATLGKLVSTTAAPCVHLTSFAKISSSGFVLICASADSSNALLVCFASVF